MIGKPAFLFEEKRKVITEVKSFCTLVKYIFTGNTTTVFTTLLLWNQSKQVRHDNYRASRPYVRLSSVVSAHICGTWYQVPVPSNLWCLVSLNAESHDWFYLLGRIRYWTFFDHQIILANQLHHFFLY